MKHFYTLIAFSLLIQYHGFSQQFEWVTAHGLDYDMNPGLPNNIIAVSDAGQVYAIHPDTSSIIFGLGVYGTMGLDCYSTAGVLEWSAKLEHRVFVTEMVTDAIGNVYLGGLFLETLIINDVDSLENTGSGSDLNMFLMCFNASGDLIWKRNLTVDHPSFYDFSVMTLDHQDNLWYGLTNFLTAEIFKTDLSGSDVISYELEGAKTLGGISFDSEGNLYISGSTGLPSMSVEGFHKQVPETYMMFVARIDAEGVTSWVELAHDITFQSPQIKADPWGNAYVGGSLMDATAFGNVSFQYPQWIYDVFITYVDALGNFQWGIQAPQSTSGITGDFERASNSFFDVDASGNLYVCGVTRGTLDWGNGVVSGDSALSYGKLSVLSFDSAGIAQWALNGGSEFFNHTGSISVSDNGDSYFSQSVLEGATYDSISVNVGGEFASVFGKIGNNIASNIPEPMSGINLNAYPIPASEFINLEFYLPNQTSVSLRIIDVNGIIVKDFTSKNLHSGFQNIYLVTEEFMPGIYFLELKTSGHLSQKKIVIN